MNKKKIISSVVLALYSTALFPFYAWAEEEETTDPPKQIDYTGHLTEIKSSLENLTGTVESINSLLEGTRAKTISGVGCLNNLSRAFDYKPEDLSYLADIKSTSDVRETLNGNEERYIGDVVSYTSSDEDNLTRLQVDQAWLHWLIENNVLARNEAFSISKYGEALGRESVIIDLNRPMRAMKKSDFLMNIYKCLYGPIESRKIYIERASYRDGSLKEDDESYIVNTDAATNPFTGALSGSNTRTDGWDFEGDWLLYVSSNVRELYLKEYVDRGIIKLNEISAGSTFSKEYTNYESMGVNKAYPYWDTNAPPYTAMAGRIYSVGINTYTEKASPLGQSYHCTQYPNWLYDEHGNRYLDSQDPETFSIEYTGFDYFDEEYVSAIELLRYVEALLRLEEDMTDTEAQIISYKYGVNYLNKLPETDKKTIIYLTAKGILSFEDKKDFANLYGTMTNEFAYRIFYRLANKEARTVFKDVQLTDSDNFWIEQGFGLDEISFITPINSAGQIELPNAYTREVTLASADVPDTRNIFQKLLGPKIALAAATDKTYTVTKVYAGDLNAMKYKGVDGGVLTGGGMFPEFKRYTQRPLSNGVSEYTFVFEVKAANEYLATMFIDSNITVDPTANMTTKQIMGVSKVKDSSGTKEVTLVPANTLNSISSDLVILEDKLLKNKKTGTMAVLLPSNGMALVGNEVIKSDSLMVRAVDGRVYYDLDIIMSLLSQAYLSTLDPNTIYVGDALSEKEVPIFTEGNTTSIASTFVATLEAQVHRLVNQDVEIVTEEDVYYNLTLASQGKNSIIYEYKMPENRAASTASGTDSITVVVDFQYTLPKSTSVFTDEMLKALTEKSMSSDDITIKDINNILMTRPESKSTTKSLCDWWDSNISLSNAICEVIYGDVDNTDYVQCGYLVPNLYILYEDNASAKELIKEFFKEVDNKLPSSYKSSYVSKMLPYYTDNSHTTDLPDFVKAMYNTGVGTSSDQLWVLLNGTRKLYFCEGKTMSLGSVSYIGDQGMHSGNFVKTKSGSIYRNIEDDRGIEYTGSKLIIKDYDSESDAPVISTGTEVTRNYNGNSLKFTYIGDNGSYMRLLCSNPVEGVAYWTTIADSLDAEPVKVHAIYNKHSPNKDKGKEYYDTLAASFPVINSQPAVREYNYALSRNLLWDSRSSTVKARIENDLPSSGITFVVGNSGNEMSAYNGRKVIGINESTYSARFAPIEKSNELPTSIVAGDPKQKFIRVDVYEADGKKLGYNLTGRSKVYAPADVIGYMVLEVSKNYYSINSNKEIVPATEVPFLKNAIVYPSSINQGMIDAMISNSVKTYRIGDLALGSYLYINGTLYYKVDKSTFNSFPITNKALLNAVDTSLSNNNSDAVGKDVLSFVGTIPVIVRGVNVMSPLSSYVISADLGYFNKPVQTAYSRYLNGNLSESSFLYSKMDGIRAGDIACKQGKKYLIDRDGGNNTVEYTASNTVPNSAIISLELDPDLLCRTFDTDSVYSLLQSVPSLSEGYIDNLPFYESLKLDRSEQMRLNTKAVEFRPLLYAGEIRSQFLEEHRKAFNGDVKSLFKMICVDLMSYMVIMSWVAYCVLNYRIGYTVLEALYKPFGNSTKGGVDFVKIFTLGTYNMESEPNFPRMVIGNVLFMLLVYMIFTYF